VAYLTWHIRAPYDGEGCFSAINHLGQSQFSLRSTKKAKFERKTGLLRNSHSTTVSDPRGPSQARCKSAHADKDTWLVGDPAWRY
jgi:hypothetical protein